MKQPSLIPWGGIALAASAIWAAACAGFHWQENKDIRTLYRATALDKDHSADIALSHLRWYYQEGMILKQEYVKPRETYVPPQYQPFFNNISQGYVPVYQVHSPIFTNAYNPNVTYPMGPPLEPDEY